MANMTLIDIAKRSGNDALVPLVEESIVGHPEVKIIPARTISGTNYKCLIREALPTAAFRHANEGATTVKARYGQKLVETFILDVPVELGLERAASRRGNETRYERMDVAFHERLRKGFRDIARREKKRCVLVDASQAIDAVTAEIRAAVTRRLKIKLQ